MKFRVGAPQLDFYIDVRVRNFEGRWLVVADIGGEPEVGLGHCALAALTASLSSLGAEAVRALLADPQLNGLTRQARDRRC